MIRGGTDAMGSGSHCPVSVVEAASGARKVRTILSGTLVFGLLSPQPKPRVAAKIPCKSIGSSREFSIMTKNPSIPIRWLPAAIFLCAGTTSAQPSELRIREDRYQDRPHFVVSSPPATYWIDRRSGGLSRLIDRDGNDWVAFKMQPWGEYPPAAASSFRGIPNAVFEGEDGGVGHPGWDQATTEKRGEHQLVTTSDSGKWELTWTFDDSGATIAITRADPDRKYWFLYEGPIAGRWAPHQQYFATDTRPPVSEPKDYFAGDRFFESWRWAYFGDRSVDRVLLIRHEQDDDLIDTFAHLGNTKSGLDSPDGMVVFGFGRGPNGIEPLLSGKNSFRLRFIEQSGETGTAYQKIKNKILNTEH